MTHLSLRTRLITTFAVLATMFVLLGGAALHATQPGAKGLDRSEAAFITALAGVEGELSTAVADLVGPTGRPWPDSLDAAFQAFADAAAASDTRTLMEDVDGLLGSAMALRRAWPEASGGDPDAVATASLAYRDAMAALHALERRIVARRTIAGAEAATTADVLQLVGVAAAAIGTGLCIIAAWHGCRGIVDPLRRATATIARAAGGDLTVRVGGSVEGEFVDLGREIDALLDATHRTIGDVCDDSADLAAAAARLDEEVGRLGLGADELVDHALHARDAAESAAVEMATALGDAEDVPDRLEALAASTAILSRSLGEIDGSAESVVSTAADAAGIAADSNARIARVVETAGVLDAVIDVVQDIAEELNVLALNSTIEAGRADVSSPALTTLAADARALARQAAEATQDIRQHVQAIHAQSSDSAEAAGRLVGAIAGVTAMAATITAGVARQDAATAEFTRKADETSTVAAQVTGHLVRSSDAMRDSGRRITDMHDRVRSSLESLPGIASTSRDVQAMAEAMRGRLGALRV